MTTASEIAEEINSPLVTAKVYKAPHCKLEIDATPGKELLAQGRKKAIKTVSKEVVLPGFRKGKAPDEMVVKRYGPAVDKEWQQAIADVTLPEVLKLLKAPLLRNGRTTYAVKGAFPSDAPLYHFTVEVEPAIPEVDAKAFVFTGAEPQAVTEEQVDEAIRQMRFFYADWSAADDRPIQEGDYLLVDLDKVLDGKKERVFTSIRFEMNPKRMAKWMFDLMLGKKSGDVVQGVSEPDADAKEEMKPQDVEITILKVEGANLPPLDDEFAKKVGAETIDGMRKIVRDSLAKLAQEKADEQAREKVNAFLTDTYPFDLPQSLIENEARHRFQQMMKDPANQKEWEGFSEEQRKKEFQDVMDDSAKAVRLFYLARKVIESAKIAVTHQEILEEAQRSLKAFGRNTGDQIPQEVFALALSKLMLHKAQGHILAQRLTQA